MLCVADFKVDRVLSRLFHCRGDPFGQLSGADDYKLELNTRQTREGIIHQRNSCWFDDRMASFSRAMLCLYEGRLSCPSVL